MDVISLRTTDGSGPGSDSSRGSGIRLPDWLAGYLFLIAVAVGLPLGAYGVFALFKLALQ